jgi:hypothetical protein
VEFFAFLSPHSFVTGVGPFPWRFARDGGALQILPLRFAPVRMTN